MKKDRKKTMDYAAWLVLMSMLIYSGVEFCSSAKSKPVYKDPSSVSNISDVKHKDFKGELFVFKGIELENATTEYAATLAVSQANRLTKGELEDMVGRKLPDGDINDLSFCFSSKQAHEFFQRLEATDCKAAPCPLPRLVSVAVSSELDKKQSGENV